MLRVPAILRKFGAQSATNSRNPPPPRMPPSGWYSVAVRVRFRVRFENGNATISTNFSCEPHGEGKETCFCPSTDRVRFRLFPSTVWAGREYGSNWFHRVLQGCGTEGGAILLHFCGSPDLSAPHRCVCVCVCDGHLALPVATSLRCDSWQISCCFVQ